MKRISVFLLVLAALSGLPLTSAVVLGGTVYVDDDNLSGPWDGTPEHPYRYIQDGIDGADAWDTVCVFAGLYFENVAAYKAVCLMGENRETTIIFPTEERSCVQIDADRVRVSGFTIRNTYSAITTVIAGIMISASCCTVTSNTVTANATYGILVADTIDYYGYLRDNLISDNIVSYNSWDGITMYYYAATVTDNTISNNLIQYNGLAGINLTCALSSIICGNTIENNQYGISTLSIVSHTTITENSISYNKHGIWTDPHASSPISNSRISGNTIWGNNLYGISINAREDTISNNVIAGNGASGIALGQVSRGNAIAQNTIMNNGEAGISFDNVRECQMFENYIVQNRCGIHLHHWATQNVVCENTIANNSDYGIFITNAFDDSIYHNEMINNGINAFNEDSTALNIWDDGYPSGGNCWNDYTGTDTLSGPGQDIPGSDGIGDTPYYITVCGQDNYPLLSGCTYLRGDANGDGTIDITDVIYLLNYLFRNGSPAVSFVAGDVNCDDEHGISDVIYLLNYLYRSGQPPGC